MTRSWSETSTRLGRTLVVGLVVGALLGLVVGVQVFRPPDADLLRSAEEMVPPEYVVEDSGVGYGFALPVLPQGEAFVDAVLDGPAVEALSWDRLAVDHGWLVTDVTGPRQDTTLTAVRRGSAMLLHVKSDAGTTSLYVTVTHRQDSLLVLLPSLVGSALGAAVALVRVARRR